MSASCPSRSRKFNVRLYVCDYGEAGNIIRREMYNTGPACSHCPCTTACSDHYPGLCSTHSNTSANHNIMCMLQMPHMVHHLTDMTMETANDIGDMMMDTFHTTGEMAMHTAHGVGNIAMDTVHTAFNTVNQVNKVVNKGFSPVTNLVNNGFNFAFSPFFGGNRNNLFRGRK